VPDTRFAAVTCGFTSWLDPATSTIHHAWIWENGGGFFGVPLVNFLGWTFTVYLFMQVFALYLHRSGPLRVAQPAGATAGDLQAVLLYAATTIPFFTAFLAGTRTTVTDAAGTTWQTGDLYETSVLLTVYGMLFIALLAVLRIAQRRSTPADVAGTVQRAEPVRPSV
jgi:putative membrane protein